MTPSVIRNGLVACVSGFSRRFPLATTSNLAPTRSTTTVSTPRPFAPPPHSNSLTTSKFLLLRSIHTDIMSSEKPKVVFVLGAPGAGKGTQCSKIVDEFGYVHLSAGDLLREERQRPGSEFGELIEDCITNGKIVPVEVTCSLLENAMNKTVKVSFIVCWLITQRYIYI